MGFHDPKGLDAYSAEIHAENRTYFKVTGKLQYVEKKKEAGKIWKSLSCPLILLLFLAGSKLSPFFPHSEVVMEWKGEGPPK